jgi:hypothetical protein
MRPAALVTLLVTGLTATFQAQPRPVSRDMLWSEPADLETRDLNSGPNGDLKPQVDSSFQFVAHKTSGKNPGYDVRDASGRVWSVKLGEEAQSEVVASRLLWAIGFHQPLTYFVGSWKLTGVDAGVKPAARFRIDLEGSRVVGEWSWYDNPFTGTPEFRGLLVAQMILNNWDLKTSNNKLYEFADGRAEYVVRDLGASLGKAHQWRLYKWFNIRDKQGSKNNVEAFEKQGFILRVDDGRVRFDYAGLDRRLFDLVTVPDVLWTVKLMSRLSDEQWHQAFAAAEYPPDIADRYITKIKAKLAQGLALAETATVLH